MKHIVALITTVISFTATAQTITPTQFRKSLDSVAALSRSADNAQNVIIRLLQWQAARDSSTNVTQGDQLSKLIPQMKDVLIMLNNRALIPDSSGFTFEGKRFRPKIDSAAAAAIATAIVDAFKEKQVRFNTGIDTRVTVAEGWNNRLSTWAAAVVLAWAGIFKTTLPQP